LTVANTVYPANHKHMLNSKRNKRKNLVDHRGLWLLAIPALIVTFMMQYLPLPGLIIAFKNYNYGLGIWKSGWSGFSNFGYLFNTGIASRITYNTIRWNLIFIVMTHSIAMIVALMMNEVSRKAVKFYQTVYFFPFFLSWVIAAYLGVALFNGDKGILNNLLELFGREGIIWYAKPDPWKIILPVANLWKRFGYASVIYYTALLGLDPQLYEAADIEGASKLQKAFRISIPQLKQLIVILVMMDIGRIFRSDFGLFYQFTRNSSALLPVTDVIDTYVYRALLNLGDPGMAAAAGLYQSVVALILVVVSNKIVGKLDSESRVF
jgi:putative aldouronate transport system permease protein